MDTAKKPEKINLGIIGCGMAWDQLHYPALQRLKDKYEIKAVCDSDLNKAKAAAQKLGLGLDKAYNDSDRFLNSSSELQIDACSVMVPIADNYNIAKSVISHKKHLIAEKPFAATPDGAKELISLAKTKGVKVLVAENWRYDEALIKIKEIIDSKRIGNVAYFIDNYITEFTTEMLGCGFSSADWRKHPDFEGGIFLDTGIHHIAKFRFLFGEPLSLYAAGRPGGSDFCPYSNINVIFKFKDHITGHYSYFNIARESQAPLVGLRIFGTFGEIYLEDKDCGFINLSFKDGGHEAISYTPNEGYYCEYLNFYNAFTTGETIVSNPEKETGDINVVFDILKSIQKDEVIRTSNQDESARLKRGIRKTRKRPEDAVV